MRCRCVVSFLSRHERSCCSVTLTTQETQSAHVSQDGTQVHECPACAARRGAHRADPAESKLSRRSVSLSLIVAEGPKSQSPSGKWNRALLAKKRQRSHHLQSWIDIAVSLSATPQVSPPPFLLCFMLISVSNAAMCRGSGRWWPTWWGRTRIPP